MSTYEANRYAFPASAIASGTLADARIPNLATSKITSGTFADARFAASNITQHVDLSNLNASNLTSGTIPNARISSGSVTQHVTSISQTTGSWTPACTGNGFNSSVGRYFKIGKLVYVVGRWVNLTGNAYSSGSGVGQGSTAVFKITGLPFTSANTSNPVLYANGSHVTINGSKMSSISCIIYHNTTEIRFFGKYVDPNSYNTSREGSTGGPISGREMSVGNAFVASNDDEEKYGGCSFCYYTD